MHLETLDGNDVTRPTAERAKEAVFSTIQFDVEGRRVREASEDDLAAVRGVAPHEAAAVYRYFHKEKDETV